MGIQPFRKNQRETLQKKIVVLYKQGLSFRDIGETLKISHETARKLYLSLIIGEMEIKIKPKKTTKTLLNIKKKARQEVFVALRNGSLKREACFCGETKTDAHHSDYFKPLEVIWLCKKHHGEKHRWEVDKVVTPNPNIAQIDTN